MQRYIVGISGASGMPLAKMLLQALHQCSNVEVHLIISQGAQRVLQTEHPDLEYDGNAGTQLDCPSDLTSISDAADITNITGISGIPNITGISGITGTTGISGIAGADITGTTNISNMPSMANMANLAGMADMAKYAHVVHDVLDIAAGPASGSWQHSGMIICPCSMSSLASIACGAGQNLLHRAADVCIKESRPLILVPRETPLSTIHLQNMLSLSKIGVKIMPPCPAFYGQTYSLEKIIEHFIARILDQLKIKHNLGFHWKEDQ